MILPGVGATCAAAAMAYWYSTMPDSRPVGVFAVFAVLDIVYGVLVAVFGKDDA